MNKFKRYLSIAGYVLFCLLLTGSCANSKRAAVPCPDFSHSRSYRTEHIQVNKAGNYSAKQKTSIRKDNSTALNSSLKKSPAEISQIHSQPVNDLDVSQQADDQDRIEYMKNLSASVERSVFPSPFNGASGLSATDYNRAYFHANDTILQTACDTIVFKLGNEVLGHVTEIGVNEIKYKECENANGPEIAILKSDVFVIKYPNGHRDNFYSDNALTSQPARAPFKKTDGFGTAGFIASLVGLFVFGIPLGILAVIFGLVSTGRISKHPETYKGKGFAIAAILIGIIDVVGMIILLSMV